MLKRLRVKNFKSLENFEVEFEKFNVLVGRNNSGKSNVIDVLSFLGEGFKDPIEKIFIRRGGYKEVVFGGNEENDIEIEAEFEVSDKQEKFLFEYYIKISGKYDAGKVIEESIKITRNNDLPEEISDLGLFGKVAYINLPYIDSNAPKEAQRTMKIFSKFLEMKDKVYGAFILIFKLILQEIYIYKITPQNIKLQYPEAFIDTDSTLDKGCENLALFLLKLSQQDKKKFERIKELLFGVVEDIDDISPTVEGKHVYLKIKDKNFDKYFYPESISDGTISLLAYITILETIKENAIICFEEPENYIHMRLLEFLVDLMKNSDKQIILVTHSPYFIDWCNPEDLIIIEKDSGETKARRIKDSEEMKESLIESGLSLGESYYSDELKNE
jgi:hypothetical protein